MTSLLNSKKMYSKYKYALYGAMISCDDIPGFLPPELQRQHEKKLGMSFDALEQNSLRQRAFEEYNARRARFLLLNDQPKLHLDDMESEPIGLSGQKDIAWIRYLLEGQSVDPKFDMKIWSLESSSRFEQLRLPDEHSQRQRHSTISSARHSGPPYRKTRASPTPRRAARSFAGKVSRPSLIDWDVSHPR